MTSGTLDSTWQTRAPKLPGIFQPGGSLVSAASGWISLGLPGGDHPNRELAPSGVKALVAVIHHLGPQARDLWGLPVPPHRPWRTSAVHLILEPPQKPAPGLALSRGRAQGTIYSQNPWGSSQGCGFQRKQPSSKLPDPGNSLARATSTQTLAAIAHVHFHTAHYCPQPLTTPVVLFCIHHAILIVTHRVQLPTLHQIAGPQRGAYHIPSVPYSLPAHLLESRWFSCGGPLWPVGDSKS